MVLATELGKHFEHVNKFISSTRSNVDEPDRSPRTSQISVNASENDDQELRTLAKRVLIKVSGKNPSGKLGWETDGGFAWRVVSPPTKISISGSKGGSIKFFDIVSNPSPSWKAYSYFQMYLTPRDPESSASSGQEECARSILRRRRKKLNAICLSLCL